ncbi:UDP-N-acetylmuramoyl-tripeptide--D-alanyl-D-alanine ligase [bacterium]|nr:UDP-N-acetylmuramoyl-tripeptide--D-alanyl-D-alanine ligase [bacterium]MBP9810716.1 UDP-N-acetylmuramoyl-tripeptide--D-alanyl-D-alanine ligase [bacterium]
MTATFTIDEILTLDGAVLHGVISEILEYVISTDSRTIDASRNLYLALKGERFDGHDFVRKAFENGAGLALIDNDSLEAVLASLPSKPRSLPVVSVPNTLAAYQGLARLYLRKNSAKVIAITGSSGKTTTKEMTAAATSARRVHKSLANENNEIGVPKTILSMPADTEILILEMGMRGLGQIAQLAACGLPDVGVITCAGSAHIELLGSLENIAKAKCELFAALDSERGYAIIGDGSKHLTAQAKHDFSGRIEIAPTIEIVSVDSSGTTFKLDSEQAFFVRAHGRVLLEDAWCAVAASRAAGLTDSEIANGLAKFAAVEGRGNALKSSHGATVVDESYNANPDSMRCAVEAILSHAYPQSAKIVVLGAMAELGEFTEPLHLELGRWLKDKPISLLVTVGSVASAIASGATGANYEIASVESQDDALQRLLPHLGSDSCIMVKGSHSTNLDKLVQKILG